MSSNLATPVQRLLIDKCLSNGVAFAWYGPGTLVIAQPGLVSILAELTKAGSTVLGFEGFELEGSVLHPRLDLIFEAAQQPGVDPVQALATWPADVWIDVALREPKPAG